MTFAGVVFRSEIAVLLAAHVLFLLLCQQASLIHSVLPAGVLGATLGLVVTMSVDSFFWQQYPLWPEWTGFYYNTVLGKSSEWGVSPWHYYFSTAISRILLKPAQTMLVVVSLFIPATRSRAVMLVGPNILFAGLYSLLPHKEWRFIIYSVPALTAAAAAAAGWLWNRRRRNALSFCLSVLTAGSILVSFAISGVSVALSSLNYPGGAAIVRLHELEQRNASSSDVVRVHLDNLSCQTGVTRFLQLPEPDVSIYDTTEPTVWKYDKTGDPGVLLNAMFWVDFDYALAEDPARVLGKWDVLDVIYGFDGLQRLKPTDSASQDVVEIRLEGGNVVHAHRPPHSYDAQWFKQLNTIGKRLRPLLKGNWIKIRMAPKIWILKQQRGTPKLDMEQADKW